MWIKIASTFSCSTKLIMSCCQSLMFGGMVDFHTIDNHLRGLSLPDITLYYYAATIPSILKWWNPQNNLTWHMAGIGIHVPLSEVIVLSGREYLTFRNSNVKTVLHIWLKYKNEWISNFSPLSSFLVHPAFQQAQLASNFKNWKRAELHRFYETLRSIFARNWIFLLIIFNIYKYICFLVKAMSKTYTVFLPFNEFKLWMKVRD